MEEVIGPVLGHFCTYRLTGDFWAGSAEDRRARAAAWIDDMAGCCQGFELYLTGGLESGSDVLVWCSAPADDGDDAARFFTARARAENPHRGFVTPVDVLWGLTRPSEYSKARSAQEIDPFSNERSPYLVAYPFTKTAEWYRLARDARQGMMNEHIRIGKQYREIRQLLLYSFGLQDQEFVVVYEMNDLPLFSRLVHELRDTEARRFTKADAPLHTGIRVERDGWLDTLGRT